MFNCKFLERISRDVISDTLVDVSKDKNLIYLVELSFKSNFQRHDLGHVLRHIDEASSGDSKLQYDVPGKSEKLLFF